MKRGALRKISGGRHSRQKAEQVWMLWGEAASCGRWWKKMWVLSNQSGDEAGRKNMGGKAPTVGQGFVTTVLCCRGKSTYCGTGHCGHSAILQRVRHLLWVRTLWPQCYAAEGKAPAVGWALWPQRLCCRERKKQLISTDRIPHCPKDTGKVFRVLPCGLVVKGFSHQGPQLDSLNNNSSSQCPGRGVEVSNRSTESKTPTGSYREKWASIFSQPSQGTHVIEHYLGTSVNVALCDVRPHLRWTKMSLRRSVGSSMTSLSCPPQWHHDFLWDPA